MSKILFDLGNAPLKNLAQRGTISPLGGEGAGVSSLTQSSVRAHSGRYSTRYQWISGSRGVSLMTAVQPALTTLWNGYKPGAVYTMIAWVYVESGERPTFRVFNGSWNGHPHSGVLTPTLYNVWQEIRIKFTAPAAGVGLRCYSFGNSPATYFVDDVMLIEGDYDGPYCDGDTPNWHWLGTPGQSESVGYPYTLESIAGAPMADLAGDGVQGAISGSALSGFTVYTVYDVSAVNVNYHSIFALSQNPLGQAPDWNNGALSYARRGGGDGTTGHIRVGTSAGNNQLGISSLPGGSTIATDTFTIGRHIGVITAPDGLASVTFMSDTSVPVTRSINAGTGIARAYIWAKASTNDVGSSSSIQKAVRTLYYPVNHDTKTRGKIVAWLSWAYGTSPLESIAGAPVAFIEGNNQSSTAPVTIDGLQGRTLYSVFDVVNQDAPNQSIIRSGAATAANGAMQLMHGNAGTDQFRVGSATLNGSDFSQSSTVSGRTIGRHIGSVAMATGAATVTGWFDAQPVISVGRTPGGGMPEATLRRSVNASHAYVYDVLFDDAHSDRTRQRITDWLRTRYATAPTISTLIGGLTNLDTVLNVSYTQTGSRPITAVIETLPLNASSGTWTAQTTTTQYVSETGMVASWTFNSSLNQQIGDTLRVRVTLTNGAGNVTSQELVMTVEDGS